MRLIRFALLVVVLFCSFGLAFAQEVTPSAGCTVESVDGQVQITGDMSACSLEDIDAMFKFLEEQVAGGFDPVDLPTPILVGTSGAWNVELYAGATDQIKMWAMQLGNLMIDPVTWSQPFNVDTAGYSSKNGFEYDATQGENSLCAQEAPCSLLVNPSYYRLVTADGVIPRLNWKCYVDQVLELGCAVSIWNVGDTADLQSRFENGFTIPGQYFNGGPLVDANGAAIEGGGEAMPVAMNALMSLAVHNMINIEGGTNTGGNCSQDTGCNGVQLTVIVTSGNELLMKAWTTYRKS